MRTLGFRTHVLLAVAAAVGVVVALGRPWYAPAAPPVEDEFTSIGSIHGPVNALAGSVSRWVGDSAGAPGWEALGPLATAIAVLAALTAAGAAGCLVPALQGVAREVLRYAALACFGLAAWKLIDTPGPNDALEPRYGAFVAAIAALVAVTSGSAVAAAPLLRRRETAPYAPPPAPPRYDAAASAPPRGS
jgi:hypothetical protein